MTEAAVRAIREIATQFGRPGSYAADADDYQQYYKGASVIHMEEK